MPTNPVAPHKVLYVEDVAVNALLMKLLFERLPECELVIAASGREALAAAAGLRPSLLLLDLRLPDIHGSELLTLLRHVEGCEHVHAVAVTAEHRYDIRGTRFDELWSKPLDLAQVATRVRELVARAADRACAPAPLRAPAIAARLAGELHSL